jgi:hypothetical protein
MNLTVKPEVYFIGNRIYRNIGQALYQIEMEIDALDPKSMIFREKIASYRYLWSILQYFKETLKQDFGHTRAIMSKINDYRENNNTYLRKLHNRLNYLDNLIRSVEEAEMSKPEHQRNNRLLTQIKDEYDKTVQQYQYMMDKYFIPFACY